MELYLKYRPKSFDELYGNETAVSIAKEAIKNGVHTFMLTGSPGCGKTTIARIMAKECGCSEMSISEINAAMDRGIDDARAIVEEMSLLPIDGSNKAYIFDEAHNMNKYMQEALLKPLEDTPSHVYFFLCTTEPKKIRKAIQTRCTIIQMDPLAPETVSKMIRVVLKNEDFELAKDTRLKIGEACGGSSRVAWKMVEAVRGIEDEEEIANVIKKLSASVNEEDNDAISLCRALMGRECRWATIAQILKELKTNGIEAENIRQAVMGYASAVLLSGKQTKTAIAALQSFSQTDTYKNGFNAIVVACLDYYDLI